jgi:hypothetical protein
MVHYDTILSKLKAFSSLSETQSEYLIKSRIDYVILGFQFLLELEASLQPGNLFLRSSREFFKSSLEYLNKEHKKFLNSDDEYFDLRPIS